MTKQRRQYRRIPNVRGLKAGSRYRCNSDVRRSDDWQNHKATALVDVVEVSGDVATVDVHRIAPDRSSFETTREEWSGIVYGKVDGADLWTCTGRPPLPGEGPNRGGNKAGKSSKPETETKAQQRTNRKVGVHHQMESLVKLATQRGADGYVKPIYLPGPSGTGKTFACKALASGLGMEFDVIGTLSDRYELTGFIDAGGKATETTFKRIWENGGVLLLDELDRSNPDATIWLNPPLDNNIAPFPGGLIERHPDCIIVATGNTRLTGPTARYTTAQRHDSAFAERFFFLDWELDLDLEAYLARGNESWLKRVRAIRETMLGMGGDFATFAPDSRAVNDGVVLLANGWSVSDVENMTALKLLDAEGKAAVRAKVGG